MKRRLIKDGIHFLWIPCSDFLKEDGEMWHQPSFAFGSGIRKGEPGDKKIFEEFLKPLVNNNFIFIKSNF